MPNSRLWGARVGQSLRCLDDWQDPACLPSRFHNAFLHLTILTYTHWQVRSCVWELKKLNGVEKLCVKRSGSVGSIELCEMV